jgi:hypothetical protein
MTGEHLSFMKDASHDDVTRIVNVERQQVPRLLDRRVRRLLDARLDVIGEVPLAHVADWPNAYSIWVFSKVYQRLIQEAPISIACRRTELFPAASKRSRNVTLGWTGDSNSTHTAKP